MALIPGTVDTFSEPDVHMCMNCTCVNNTAIPSGTGDLDLLQNALYVTHVSALGLVACVLGATGLLLVAVSAVLIAKYRHEQTIRAASPILLWFSLLGCALLFSQLLLQVVPANNAVCIALLVLRHQGTIAILSTICLRQWRIYAITRLKIWRHLDSRRPHLRRGVCAVVILTAVYQILWCWINAEVPITHTPHVTIGCKFNEGTYIIVSVELLLAAILIYLSQNTKHVPTPYNDSCACTFFGYNCILGVATELSIRLIQNDHMAPNLVIFLCIFRVQAVATTCVVCLVCVRIYGVMCPNREATATLAHVSKHTQGHRLRIILDNTGHIKTVTCYPCGPLLVSENKTEADVDDAPEVKRISRVAGYTEAEIDRLIDMYEKQKAELAELHFLLNQQNTQTNPRAFADDDRNCASIVLNPKTLPLKSPPQPNVCSSEMYLHYRQQWDNGHGGVVRINSQSFFQQNLAGCLEKDAVRFPQTFQVPGVLCNYSRSVVYPSDTMRCDVVLADALSKTTLSRTCNDQGSSLPP